MRSRIDTPPPQPNWFRRTPKETPTRTRVPQPKQSAFDITHEIEKNMREEVEVNASIEELIERKVNIHALCKQLYRKKQNINQEYRALQAQQRQLSRERDRSEWPFAAVSPLDNKWGTKLDLITPHPQPEFSEAAGEPLGSPWVAAGETPGSRSGAAQEPSRSRSGATTEPRRSYNRDTTRPKEAHSRSAPGIGKPTNRASHSPRPSAPSSQRASDIPSASPFDSASGALGKIRKRSNDVAPSRTPNPHVAEDKRRQKILDDPDVRSRCDKAFKCPNVEAKLIRDMTVKEKKDCYKKLVLQIHPDKTPQYITASQWFNFLTHCLIE